MAVREAIQRGNPKLKAKNKTVADFKSPKVKQVIKDLNDTMVALNLIGMAAPQIGENYQIFITHPRKTQYRADGLDDKLRVFINPKIVFESSEKVVIYEGCGSTEEVGVFGPVERPRVVTVEAIDENGKKFQVKADGLLGRVMQHEMDHLEGMEFLDRIADEKQLVDKETYIKEYKESPERIRDSKITLLEVTY